MTNQDASWLAKLVDTPIKAPTDHARELKRPITRVPRCPKCGSLMHRGDDGASWECSCA